MFHNGHVHSCRPYTDRTDKPAGLAAHVTAGRQPALPVPLTPTPTPVPQHSSGALSFLEAAMLDSLQPLSSSELHQHAYTFSRSMTVVHALT
jgi:hypothetical protein